MEISVVVNRKVVETFKYKCEASTIACDAAEQRCCSAYNRLKEIYASPNCSIQPGMNTKIRKGPAASLPKKEEALKMKDEQQDLGQDEILNQVVPEGLKYQVRESDRFEKDEICAIKRSDGFSFPTSASCCPVRHRLPNRVNIPALAYFSSVS